MTAGIPMNAPRRGKIYNLQSSIFNSRLWRGLSLAAICFLFLASPAFAQERSQYDPHWFESPRHFSAGFNVGLVFPTADEFQDVYGTKGDAIYTLQAGWRMIHELELHAEGSYFWFEGRGVTSTGDKTQEKFKLHAAPAELGLLYRLAFVPDQIVVPYVGAGYALTYWFEEKLDSSSKNRGLLNGWVGQAGLMVLLDNIEKRSSGRLESDWGINNTYFFYQFKYLAADDFGGGDDTFDLTSMAHSIGVLFQF
ncbi:hypothetical protein K8I61_05985 [bacterium]|nr:hypothetical protein [bacterium]